MANFPRRTWTTLLFVGLLAPFAVALLLAYLAPVKGGSAGSATQSGAGSPLLGPGSGGAGIASPPGRAAYPLFAAGDEKTLWVAQPEELETGGKKNAAFEMFVRSNGTGIWTLLRDSRGNPFMWDYPRGLATASAPAGKDARATPYVFFESGKVQVFGTSGKWPQDGLPTGHRLVAVAGSVPGIFALTEGPADPSTTRPGDVLQEDWKAGEKEVATTGATGTGAASQAAGTQAGRVSLVNGYWFRDSHWAMLPAIGTVGEAGAAPSHAATVGLVHQGNRLIALWVEPGNPRELVARFLDYHHGTGWSAAVVSELPEALPAGARLLPIVLDQSVYVFWGALGGSDLELRGGRLGTELGLAGRNFLPPMVLKGTGKDLDPGVDVAIAPVENSIGVVVHTKDNGLSLYVFSQQGELASGPSVVEPQGAQRDVQFAQNIAVMLLVLMLTLSFWQWRQRPGPLKLPSGMRIATMGMRAGAFLIDFAIPYLAVCTVYGLWENGGYVTLLTHAGRSVLNFEVLFGDPRVLVLLGIYLLHVTVGEMFFRRSIGKAILGLQVLMIDGKAPTLGATLVRNLIRLPELLLLIAMIYMSMSPNRQRLGDLVARTVVISQKPPGEEGDAAEPGEGK